MLDEDLVVSDSWPPSVQDASFRVHAEFDWQLAEFKLRIHRGEDALRISDDLPGKSDLHRFTMRDLRHGPNRRNKAPAANQGQSKSSARRSSKVQHVTAAKGFWKRLVDAKGKGCDGCTVLALGAQDQPTEHDLGAHVPGIGRYSNVRGQTSSNDLQ